MDKGILIFWMNISMAKRILSICMSLISSMDREQQTKKQREELKP